MKFLFLTFRSEIVVFRIVVLFLWRQGRKACCWCVCWRCVAWRRRDSCYVASSVFIRCCRRRCPRRYSLQWLRNSQTQLLFDLASVVHHTWPVSRRWTAPAGDLRPSGKHAGRPADVTVCMYVCNKPSLLGPVAEIGQAGVPATRSIFIIQLQR